jgi:hypothetical protein
MFYALLLFVRANSITDITFPGTIIVWVTFVFAEYSNSTGYVIKVGVATCKAFPLKRRHFRLRGRGIYFGVSGELD